MPEAPELLRVRGLTLHSAGLRDVSFDCAAGRVLAVLGPAGAGKSALLALLAGLAVPDSGTVVLGGADLADVRPHRRGVGLVVAGENLFPHLTVAQNVALPLRSLNAAARRARVADVLESLHLRSAASQYPSALVPLAAARGALARALAAAPQLLLLDDPWDAPTTIAMLTELARPGQGVILATSDGSLARAVADDIIVLIEGAIAQRDTPRRLYDRPVSAAVAACVGEVSRLPGRLVSIADDVAEVALDCGPVVEAMHVDAGPVGAPCAVLIRPERVALAAGRAAELGEGAVPATVSAVSDRGEHLRVDLLVGEARFTVRRPARTALVPGSTVALAWQAQDAWACRSDG